MAGNNPGADKSEAFDWDAPVSNQNVADEFDWGTPVMNKVRFDEDLELDLKLGSDSEEGEDEDNKGKTRKTSLTSIHSLSMTV